MKFKYVLVVLIVISLLILLLITRYKPTNYEAINYNLIDTVGSLPLDKENWLHHPKAISKINNKLTFVDSRNNRFLICEKDFSNCISVGRKGKGPGEFLNPGYIKIRNNNIYVSDCDNNRLQIFNSNGKFIKSINLKIRLLHILNFSISTNGNLIFIPATDGEFLFYTLNVESDSLEGVGTPVYKGDDNRENMVQNVVLLETDENDNVYAGFYGSPIVRKYNNENILEWESDLSNIDPIIERYSQINEMRRDNETMKYAFIDLFEYLYYDSGLLYVIYITPDKDYWSKRILGIDTNTGRVKVFIEMNQDEFIPNSFCFLSKRIYATDTYSNKILVLEKM